MTRKLAFAIGLSAVVALSLPVSALSAQAQYGTEQDAKARKLTGKYVIPLQNTTQQPLLTSLES